MCDGNIVVPFSSCATFPVCDGDIVVPSSSCSTLLVCDGATVVPSSSSTTTCFIGLSVIGRVSEDGTDMVI